MGVSDWVCRINPGGAEFFFHRFWVFDVFQFCRLQAFDFSLKIQNFYSLTGWKKAVKNNKLFQFDRKSKFL